MNETSIEWCFDASGKPAAGYTYNPVRGCSRDDVDCEHCYAERLGGRFAATAFRGFVRRTPTGALWTGKLAVIDDKVEEPLRVSIAKTTGAWMFAGSMSDIFHPSIPDDDLDHVIAVLFLVNHMRVVSLTKRPMRAAIYFRAPGRWAKLQRIADRLRTEFPQYSGISIDDPAKRLPTHIWWGMSAGNQATYDKRWDGLRQIPALTKVLSLEPLLGPIDYRSKDTGANWIITGSESGPDARPAEVDWVRDIRDQAQSDNFFFKQWKVKPCGCRHAASLHEKDFGCSLCECRWSRWAPEDGIEASEEDPSNLLSTPYLDGMRHASPPHFHATGPG